MPRYVLIENTPQSMDRYELAISDDGTFVWSYGASDPAGDMGGGVARGTWKRSGDAFTFTVTEGGDGIAVPTTATLSGKDLAVAGIGSLSEQAR
jgi:hypothetical protein